MSSSTPKFKSPDHELVYKLVERVPGITAKEINQLTGGSIPESVLYGLVSSGTLYRIQGYRHIVADGSTPNDVIYKKLCPPKVDPSWPKRKAAKKAQHTSTTSSVDARLEQMLAKHSEQQS